MCELETRGQKMHLEVSLQWSLMLADRWPAEIPFPFARKAERPQIVAPETEAA